MDENVVQISVRRRIAERSGGARAIVADNTEYTIQFLFDEEWRAYPTKTALFVRDDGLCYPPVLMEDGADCCKIPRINGTGHIRIGVTAGDITTTTPAEVRVLRSVLEAAGQVLDKPPAGVWADVLEKFGSAVKYAPESRTEEEKARDRENIGAISADEVPEQVQADWSENNTESPAFIKNRSFWSGDLTEIVMLKEQTVNIGEDGALELGSDLILKSHNYYKVISDEEMYECTPLIFTPNPGYEFILIGDPSIAGMGER